MEKFFINRPIFAIVISVVIVLLGLLSLRGLPVEQYPDITPPVVSVSATYPGANAQTVNDAVATPIAQSIMGVSDMLYMQTTSANDGSMSLQIQFDIDSNPDLDEIFTQNKVAAATGLLPSAVTQQGVTTQKSQTGFLLIYAIYSDGRYNPSYLSNYAYINIQNELLKINGVGKVQIMGAGEYSMRVWVKPDRMDYYNIAVADIRSAIEAQGEVYSAGKLGEQPLSKPVDFTYTITTPARIDSAEEYGNIIVKSLPDGQEIRLSDVARVELGSESYGIMSDFDGRPATLVAVYQTPGSNAVEVGGRVKAEMASLGKSFPDGIGVDTVIDATQSIESGIDEIFRTMLFTLALVIIIIFIFLQDWRATIIPLVAVHVSIIGAFMIFPLLGFTVNIISLLGLVLAIGLVVDDAIVVVEAVQVGIEQGLDSRHATLDAMRHVSSPIIATTVVLLAVFVPAAMMNGITGKLFQQFAMGISVSVVISSFNALTLSPALCSMLLRPKKRADKGFFGAFNRWFDRRMDGYMKASAVIVRHSIRTLILVGATGAAIFMFFKVLPSGFLTTEDQGYLMVMADLPDAASVTRTAEAMGKARGIISQIDGVNYQSTSAGFDLLTGIASSNSGIIFVTLEPYGKRKLSAGKIAELINARLYDGVPEGTFYAFEPPSIPGLGVTSGITFMLQERGDGDIGYLARQTELFMDEARKLPEIANISSQFDMNVPQRRLEIDDAEAMQQGVSIEQLHSLISTFLGGAYVNNFNRFGKLYQTYIQADSEYRRDKDGINNFYIRNGQGQSIPVASFVRIVDTVGVQYLSQFNLYDAIAVTATPSSSASSAQAMAALQKLADTGMPDDIALAWSGISYQEAGAAGGGNTYLLAVVFVFLALAALYNSWALPFSILLGVPFAVFGAMLFVWVAHMFSPVYVDNVFMDISLVMLIGLAAKNAILIVEYADKLFFDEGRSLGQAALGAAKLRLRPILMTAFSFVIGVMPLVFASGAYSVARRVMGVALVGGMGVATLLGIFVYPALYYIVGRLARFDRKRERLEKLEKL